MHGSIPITWNGVGPRLRNPDPLWDVLCAMLVLIADRGERIRWRSKPAPTRLEVHLLVHGTWYEMVPPPWRMPHLVNRLVSLTAQDWWDRWGLRRQHRRHVRGRDFLTWERTVTLRFGGKQIPATCRIVCDAQAAEVELAIAVPGEQLSVAAVAAIPDFQQLVFQTWDKWLE